MMIPMPSWPVPRKIEWSLDQPAQANRGEFTGKRRVTLLFYLQFLSRNYHFSLRSPLH